MHGLLLPQDYGRISDLVRDGDPVVGWRGDPSMDTYLVESTGEVEVWAFDAHGQRYRACSVDATRPGWKHELLCKLRDGDPQRTSIDDWVKAQEAKQAAMEKAHAEKRAEVAEKAAWALRKDIGQQATGLSKDFY